MNDSPSPARKKVPARRKYIYPLSTRQKMRAAHLGRKLSPQHKRAVSKGLRAYHEKRLVPDE
jgi:hypothetical protein